MKLQVDSSEYRERVDATTRQRQQIRLRRFGEISFPVAAELYLRQKEIDKLQGKYKRTFQTKTTMAVNIVKRLVLKFTAFGKPIEIIVDGGQRSTLHRG